MGEEKRGKITGLHNCEPPRYRWHLGCILLKMPAISLPTGVQYYLEEKAGNIDYLGWAGKQDSDYSDDVNLVTVKFSWEDDDDDTPETELKPMSTILCGSTVQFEMAVLSLAFLCGEPNGDNELTLGSEEVKITCYSQRQRCEAPSRSHASGGFPFAMHVHLPDAKRCCRQMAGRRSARPSSRYADAKVICTLSINTCSRILCVLVDSFTARRPRRRAAAPPPSASRPIRGQLQPPP